MYIDELEEKIYGIVSASPDEAFTEAFSRYIDDNGGHGAFRKAVSENKLGMSYEVWFVSDIPESTDKMYNIKIQVIRESLINLYMVVYK